MRPYLRMWLTSNAFYTDFRPDVKLAEKPI